MHALSDCVSAVCTHVSNMECCIPVCCRKTSNVISFSEASFIKFKDCSLRWKSISSAYGEIAAKCWSELNLINCSSPADIPRNVGYHRECYQRFTDVSKLTKAEQRRDLSSIQSDNPSDIPDDNTTEPPEPKKARLRSREAATCKSDRPHIFPAKCLICKADRWTRDRSSGARKREPLTKCETIEAGQLRKAAELTFNDTLLLEIQDRDLVAAEAQYHKSCYKDTTRFLTRAKKDDAEKVDTTYGKAFEVFCKDYVENQILRKNEIYRMKKLRLLFIKMVRKVQGVDASSYRTYSLKKRLQRSYPQLQFIKPNKRNDSEIVMSRLLEAKDIAEEALTNEEEGLSSSEQSGNESTDDESTQTNEPSKETKLSEIYFTARKLRESIQSIKMATPWPPGGQDLTLDKAREIIPVSIYNFLAWVMGSSDDPEEDRLVTVSESDDQRIVSLAQDIIYHASSGRKQMPKHLALGMTIRHMTGSAKLIGILNGFGHTVSHSAVLEHDTAIAEQQIKRGPLSLPPFIEEGRFTTLVWDNNDFGEETISGKGTTHNTNGIVIQREFPQVRDTSTAQAKTKKKKKRSLDVPPRSIATCINVQRKGPVAFANDISLTENVEMQLKAHQKDNVFALIRQAQSAETPHPPSWTGFNTLLCKTIPPKSMIGYLPVIDASPTEMDTVYTILLRSLEIANKLGLEQIVVVLDQAIYAKAQELRWRNEVFKNRIIIRLGAFHTSMCFMACIGKRFQDSGLDDIAIESEVVAHGSLNGIMGGSHYNRSVRFHKLMYEALHRLRFQAYLKSLSGADLPAINAVLDKLRRSFPVNFEEALSDPSVQSLLQNYLLFVKTNSTSPTVRYWNSYLEMVQVLLLFLRASREGDWNLHLSSLRSMMPWFMAYDRVNYSRYSSVYWLEMQHVTKSNHTLAQHFQNGEFSVQRQQNHGFSGVPCDMTIEQTMNRDSKTKGGLIGITTNKAAVHRWIASFHVRAEIAAECQEMAGKGDKSRTRKDLDITRNAKDEQDIQALVATIESMTNPFELDQEELVHLTSGIVAPDHVAKGLLHAKEKGEEAVKSFIQKRLQTNEVDFFDPIKSQRLETFASIGERKKVKVKGKEMELKSNRNLFARLLVCGKVRNISMETILQYSLGPLPLSLATHSGTLVKHPKAKLMHHLESLVVPEPYITTIPKSCIWIVDGMAMIQQFQARDLPPTFGEFSELVMKELVKLAKDTAHKEIHFVTDRYPQESIKNAERQKRASTSGVQRYKIHGQQVKMPKQFKKFMSSGPNKEELVSFFFNDWQRESRTTLLNGVTIYMSHGDECYSLSVVNGEIKVQEQPELHCNHEEADTRMLLHCQFAAKSADSIMIRSPDTDVFVLGVALAKEISETADLFFYTGQKRKRIVDLSGVSNWLGDKRHALIGFHSFTGCDTVSSFHGKGKVKVWKLMEEENAIELFQLIGSTFTLSAELVEGLEKFTCAMYCYKECLKVNEARYRHFTTRADKSDSAMPPNLDCLKKHILRANYQAAIWKRSLECKPNIPNPVGHGWRIEEESLTIDWMSMAPAPEEVLELTYCGCKKSHCDKSKCSCAKNNLPCTEVCKCVNCENNIELNEEHDVEYNSEDEH